MASRVLKVLTYSSDMFEDDNFPEIYRNWIVDGGTPTFEAFMELEYKEKIHLLSYMSSSLLFEEIEVNGKKFHLSHTVPNKKTMRFHERMPYYDYLIGEPEYGKEYFHDKFIVTGHTLTGFIDPKYKGRIWRKNNHIAVDCGAVFGNPFGCICLDNFEEFYVK
jgi:serine/threonine protein phosphatase 1